MAGGMATIAGGVLASYIGFLGGEDHSSQVYFAKHLLTASLMSAPAAIVFAKILVPEKEKINEDLTVAKEKLGTNALEAITNGTTDGLRLAVNVGAMLLVFISLMAFANYLLWFLGHHTGLNGVVASWGHYDALSFQAILGYTLSPFAWILGVPWEDCMTVGQLLGEKTILNEFVAYMNLGNLKHIMSDKSTLMCTYVLCGFANFASIGIQVGGIGSLAPEKKSILAKYGVKALIAGTLACMSTAVIAGMLF
jgi:CNT family concentrative nucleoside transporter